MTQLEKLIKKMQTNPNDWHIDDLKKLAERYQIIWRQNGTSHVQFVREDGITLTVPAHRPIKPIYVKKFLKLIKEEL